MKNERGKQMKNTNELLEEGKQNTISKLSQIVENYYEKYGEAGEKKSLTIDHIEQFLIDCKQDVDRVLKEASTDILRKMEGVMIEKKTFAHVAEKD